MSHFQLKISNFTQNVFLSGSHGLANKEILRKIILMNSISSLGIIVLVTLGLVAFVQGAIFLATMDFLVAMILMSLLLYMRFTGKYLFCCYCGVAVLAFLYLYLFVTGGVNGTGFMWLYTFPLVALFLLGSLYGVLATIFLFVPTLIFLGIDLQSSDINLYNLDFAFRFVPSFLTVFLFSFMAEKSRATAHRELLLAHDKLEGRVAERTTELQVEINQRKRAQKDTLQAKEEWERTFNAVDDLIVILNDKHEIIRANRAMAAKLKMPLEDIMYKPCYEIMHGTDKPPLYCPHLKVMEDRQPHSTEGYRDVLKGYYNITVSPLYDSRGDCYGAVHLARDITVQKKAEQEKVEIKAKLHKAEKMEAIGLMAGGVAHDLNNILSGLISYPELLLLKLPQDSELRDDVEALKGAGKRAAAVVADLLTVARGVASVKKTANLNSLVSEYLNSPEYKRFKSLHANVSFITELDPFLSNITCSPIHIKKCLMNLMTNGAESIGEIGSIAISTRNQMVDQPIGMNYYVEKGEYAVLSITDTGSGIAKKDMDHIFEPFYTKKIMGISGTGLGLAVVWNTVQDHGGGITVDSSEQGTVFELYFPISNEKIDEQSEIAKIENLQGNGEHILIVDDEALQRDIAIRSLSVLGYHPHSVSSGEEAIEYLKHNSVDLVLLDMLMEPGMNGRETYGHIIKIHPGQKAMIVSGFSENDEVLKARQLGVSDFIRKPYTMEEIGKAVQKELKENSL